MLGTLGIILMLIAIVVALNGIRNELRRLVNKK